jgi:hypothetical protein
MPIGTPKRRPTEHIDSTSGSCVNPGAIELAEALLVRNAGDLMDADSIEAFRSLFELLDRWDREENENEK